MAANVFAIGLWIFLLGILQENSRVTLLTFGAILLAAAIFLYHSTQKRVSEFGD
ncbi:membrane protein [Rhodopirellula maiorica SM1]|uniref:Membrane protein n=1 Tax=Rhodopirellula maiorica SM1 TaxID=1265738 RepID=M5RHY7_9BACT|nr:membrane protein [Rhodopirellula maiorica SM1]